MNESGLIYMSDEEKKTLERHLKLQNLTVADIVKTWRNEGTLCAAYPSGKWWHYNDRGEWW